MALNTEKLANGGLALLLAYTAVSGVARAGSKPFWLDEIITVELARKPGISGIVSALQHAVDSHPPAFYVVEKLASRLPVNELVAVRLPSILAFCCVVLCIFLFVRKRQGGLCALLCAAIPLLSTLFVTYAVEARGYSLMAGFVALAMVCYQRVDRVTWWITMGLSLAAAEAVHYYAVFATIPFVLAEFALLVKHRQVRLRVWLALLCGVLPLVLFWHLLQTLKHFYSLFWNRPSLTDAIRAYGWVFDLPAAVGLGIAGAGAAAIVIYGLLRWRGSSSRNVDEIPVQESFLALGILALPILAYAAISVLHGGFTTRYVLLVALGFPLAAGYVLASLDRRMLLLFSILLLGSLGVQEAAFWRGQLSSSGKMVSPAASVERLVAASGHDELPLVVSDGVEYIQLAYYASPQWNDRFVYLVDIPAEIAYAGTNVDKNQLVLRSYMQLQVYEFVDFARNHPDFLLYSGGSSRWDWWASRLLHDGYALDLMAIDQQKRIYLVRQKR